MNDENHNSNQTPEDAGPTLEELLRDLEAESPAEPSVVFAGPGAQPPGTLPAPRAGRHLVFSLAGSAYAFPVETVLEASRLPAVTPLPFVPAWILGIANLRGDVLSVVDLRAFLGLAPANTGPDDRLVVVRSLQEDLLVGLVVDRIKGIFALSETPSMPTAPLKDPIAPFLAGTCEREGSLLTVLNMECLLLSPEMRQFDVARTA